MSNDFNVCPMCQSRNIIYKDNKKWFCPDCGFDLYNNVAAAVGLIIVDIDGSIIFEVRAKEPRKGFLAVPGGFCDQDESAEEAALRECMEETGITPASVQYLTSFPNTYEYKEITYKTCDLFFIAEFNPSSLPKGKKIIDCMKNQESEVVEFKGIKINSLEDIENFPAAFPSLINTLKVWYKRNCK
ncbi:MAG: NUDIX domain-containing protein [Treponema sp.]|uniref:NUDIX hydrolase n=1 Tax=Treponema sp. TaxID=166 RepID=UPI00298DE011|nr:NUDIX domain-containing protein [Treponema sp.]MCR5385824.1 NUDIX domain-containing protein [Treponema sp.]